MSKVTLDKATLAKLTTNGSEVEITDDAGNVVGYFRRRELKELYENAEVPFTDEEIERALAEPGGRTLPEILSDLEKLP